MKKTILDKSNQAVINLTLIAANIATFSNILSNLFQHKETRYLVVSILVFLLSLFLTFTKEKWSKNDRFMQIMSFVIACVVFPIIWLNSHGAVGSMPFYSILFLVILTYILQDRWRIIIPVIYLIEIILLMRYQLVNPSAFENLPSVESMIQNLLFNYVIVSLLLFLLILILRKHYEVIQSTLLTMATTDELTHVHNRRYIIDTLKKLTEKNSDTPDFSIVFADINDFKGINDTYGHKIGDEVLQCFGDTLNSNLRPSDICGRYGGDEFVIIFPNTSLDDAKEISERLTRSFNENLSTIIDRKISLALGFTTGKGKSVETLLKNADERMYQQKCMKS